MQKKPTYEELEKQNIQLQNELQDCKGYDINIPKTILDTIAEPTSLINNNYQYIFVNEAYSKLFSKTKQEIIGSKIEGLIGQEKFRNEVQPHFDKCLQGKLVSYENVVNKNGIGEKHLLMNYYPYYNAQGKVAGVISTAKDVTSEARLKKDWNNTINSLEDTLLIINHNFEIEHANNNALKLLNKTKGEIVGHKCYKIVHGVEAPVDDCPLKKTLKTGKTEVVERYEKKFKRWVSLKSSPIKNHKGEVVKFVDLIKDITLTKETGEELRKNEKNFQKMLKAIPDMVSIHDTNMNILYSNWNGFAAIEKEKRILNTKCYKTYREYDKICPDCKAKKVIKSKKAYQEEVELPDGNWVDLRVIPLKDDNNNVTSFVEWVRFITDRKKAEREIRESNEELRAAEEELKAAYDELKDTYGQLEEEKSRLEVAKNIAEENEAKFRELTEMLPETVYEMDINGNISFLNQSGLKKFKYSKNEVEKEINVLDCFVKEDHEKLKGSIAQNLKGIKNSGNTYNAVKKDGTVFPVLIHNSPIKKDNRIVGLRGILIDISELRSAEKLKNEVKIAEHTAKLKQQFLANMSHEMRTPMTGIIGMTEFLMDTNLDKQQEDYLNIIKNSSESLLFLINDILDISKIERGKMDINPETINVLDTLNNVINIFSGPVKQKELKLISNFEKDFPNHIHIDENRFKQIISNLISNAVKYTKTGFIKVKLSKTSIENNFVRGKVNIIDTGIGINQENLSKVFEMFTRVDDSFTRKTEGTGLGLHISKQLAGLLKGDIGVESVKGKGSNFWFTFKAEIKEASKVVESKKVFEDEIISKHLNILLAEDKFVNQKVISMMLENLGCKVQLANNGYEAIEQYKKHQFDIIFMDIMMPEMDGITAMKQLRILHSKLPPVIGLSAHAMQGDAEKFITLGMDDYIEKPVKKETLLRKLKKWSG